MKLFCLLILLGCTSIKAQRLNRFELFQPFQTSRFSLEDIGFSIEGSRMNKENSVLLGGYYSVQSSAVGAGIWFHTSGFLTAKVYPDINDMNLSLGVNGGVTFLILETKLNYDVRQDHFSLIPAAGIGINRILYGMIDFQIQNGQNNFGGRLVLRLPVFTRTDKNVSGFTPAYE